MLLFSFHDKRGQKRRGLHILLPYFFSRCEQYNLLLPLLRNCCSLVDPFVYWRFNKVFFESISLFWKHPNKL